MTMFSKETGLVFVVVVTLTNFGIRIMLTS